MKSIEFNMCAAPLTQDIVDRVIAVARASGEETVSIHLLDVSTNPLPHLVVDYGDLIHTLVQEINLTKSKKEN